MSQLKFYQIIDVTVSGKIRYEEWETCDEDIEVANYTLRCFISANEPNMTNIPTKFFHVSDVSCLGNQITYVYIAPKSWIGCIVNNNETSEIIGREKIQDNSDDDFNKDVSSIVNALIAVAVVAVIIIIFCICGCICACFGCGMFCTRILCPPKRSTYAGMSDESLPMNPGVRVGSNIN